MRVIASSSKIWYVEMTWSWLVSTSFCVCCSVVTDQKMYTDYEYLIWCGKSPALVVNTGHCLCFRGDSHKGSKGGSC